VTGPRRHSRSDKVSKGPTLSIRTCVKCELQMYSCHDWSCVQSGGDRGVHHKEYYTADHPDVRLMVMPECRR
jgi:hypothetical protein